MHCKERKIISGKRLRHAMMNRRASTRKTGQIYCAERGFSAQRNFFENASAAKTHIGENRAEMQDVRHLSRFFARQIVQNQICAMRCNARPNDKSPNFGDSARPDRLPCDVRFRKHRANADRHRSRPAKPLSSMHDADKNDRAVRHQVHRKSKAPAQRCPAGVPSRVQKHIPKPKWYVLSLISPKANLQTVRRKKRSCRCVPDRQTAKR